MGCHNSKTNGNEQSRPEEPLPPILLYQDILNATRYFSHDTLIGSGGFGSVFRAEIRGRTYAVKRLAGVSKSIEIDTRQFKLEIKALERVSHPNIVNIVTYCEENGEKLIVLEYFPNSSLRYQLRSEARRANLTWARRRRIAIGAAQGLVYLHDKCKPKIIHRDVKTDNIVLDDKFEAKVIDFGLVKLFPEGSPCSHISDSSLKGTAIYVDPEYLETERVSDKLDVYSFGVVLLELISGRSLEVEGVSIVNWAKSNMEQALGEEDNITPLIDPELIAEAGTESSRKEMKMLVCCANACLRKRGADRPKMRKIVDALDMKIAPDKI
ncbi:Leucine-rich receptor-like protein kinase family protein [Euphorbia peplus]|nr:Leucine-rich receptor-like protein kinase family protein [Euphorbia peplus]